MDENYFAVCVYLLGVYVCLTFEKAKTNYPDIERFAGTRGALL